MAIELLKEMYGKIPELSPQAVNLTKTNNSDPFIYAIEFTGLCQNCEIHILEIAKNKELTVKQQTDKLTIYSNVNSHKSFSQQTKIIDAI